MPTPSETVRLLERAFDRAHMHECPGDPAKDTIEPCNHTALDHMSDRTMAIVERTIFQHMDVAWRTHRLDLARDLSELALRTMEMSRLLAAVGLSCIAAAHDDPDWARRVTETFRRALAAMEFSGELDSAEIVDMSADYLRWMRPE